MKRHSPEERVKKLREAAVKLAGGAQVEDVFKQLGVSAPTYFRLKEKYAGAEESTVKKLRELEKENAPPCGEFLPADRAPPPRGDAP